MIKKEKKQRKLRKSSVIKTLNNGTFTNSMFWSFIRSCLRNKSRWWKPITQCRLNNRRAYKGINKRQKFEYFCHKCKQWFPDKEISVDHIIPVGTLTCAEDLAGFVTRLFVEIGGLQTLCSTCHDEKTKEEKNGNRKQV